MNGLAVAVHIKLGPLQCNMQDTLTDSVGPALQRSEHTVDELPRFNNRRLPSHHHCWEKIIKIAIDYLATRAERSSY